MRLDLLGYFAAALWLGAGCTATSPLPSTAPVTAPQLSPLAPPLLSHQAQARTPVAMPAPVSMLPSTLPVTCTQHNDQVQCHDDFLKLDFSYPAFFGQIGSVDLRPGGYAGLAYDYVFGESVEAATAGGRSQDFSEGRERSLADQSGFGTGLLQGVCDFWGARICKEASPWAGMLVLLPDSSDPCDGGMTYHVLPPTVLIVVNLPEHPSIHGFGVASKLYPSSADVGPLGDLAGADMNSDFCTDQGRQIFDSEIDAIVEALEHGSAHPTLQTRYDAFMTLAQSFRGPYTGGDAVIPGDRTYGLPVVDDIRAAVTAGDATRLGELIHYSTFRCGQVAALGGPPACREGEPEGTTVAGLPLLDAEGVFARPDEQEGWLRAFLDGNPVLVGVYAQPGGLPSEADWLPATHALVFVGVDRPTIATVLSVDDEGIVSVYTDAAPAALLARITGDLVAPSLLSP